MRSRYRYPGSKRSSTLTWHCCGISIARPLYVLDTPSRRRLRHGKRSTNCIYNYKTSTTNRNISLERSLAARLLSRVAPFRVRILESLGADWFSHKYRQLPLIPVEDFVALFPEHVGDDEDTLMRARINHENEERKALEQTRQELLRTKQSLIAENKKRKDDLSNLDNDLEKLIDVSPFGCQRGVSRSRS